MKPINRVIKKMCDVINVNYKDIDTMKEGWFNEYTWTAEQEEEFRVWFESYLYKSAEARREIMEHPIKNKKIINKLVTQFIFNYGWEGDLYGN